MFYSQVCFLFSQSNVLFTHNVVSLVTKYTLYYQKSKQQRTDPKIAKHSTFNCLKGIVHPKMKILSSFSHPQVVPNLYVFICSDEHKGKYLEECFHQTDLNPHLLPY